MKKHQRSAAITAISALVVVLGIQALSVQPVMWGNTILFVILLIAVRAGVKYLVDTFIK